MKFNAIHILLIGILCISIGCRSVQKVSTFESVVDLTTVERSVSFRDTSVKVSADSASVSISMSELETLLQTDLLPFISYEVDGPSEKKILIKSATSGRANVNLYKQNNTLIAEGNCRELEIQLELKDSVIKIQNIRLEQKVTTKIEQVKFIPLWVKILAWIGGISLLLLLLFLAYNFFFKKNSLI